MTNATDVDIAIIGGGMVGLSQALLLAWQLPEKRIVLVESLPLQGEPEQPSFDGRSTALSAAAAELFNDMGLWPALAERAEPIRRVHVSDRGHIGSVDFSERENASNALGFVLENRWFGQHLCAAVKAAGIEVWAPASVERIYPTVTGARVQVERNGERVDVSAALVIISDGAESPLRAQLGIGTIEYDYRQTAIVANLEFERPHGGQAFERFTREGPLAILPLPALDRSQESCRAALVWTRPQDAVAATLAWSDDGFARKLQQHFGFRLGHCVRVGTRNSYALNMVFAREQVRSGVVLVGNAAHFLHPVAGQGFNLALRDCAQLTAVLRDACRAGQSAGDITVLQRYLANQKKDQQMTASLSHNLIRVFNSQNPVLQVSRNLGLLTLALWGGARRQFFQQMMGQAQSRGWLQVRG